jgi:hypothetical protein
VESTSFTASVGTLLVHLVGSIGPEQPQNAIAVWPLTIGVWLALGLGLLWAWRLRQRGLLLIGAEDDSLRGEEGVDSLNGGSGNDECLETDSEGFMENCQTNIRSLNIPPYGVERSSCYISLSQSSRRPARLS